MASSIKKKPLAVVIPYGGSPKYLKNIADNLSVLVAKQKRRVGKGIHLALVRDPATEMTPEIHKISLQIGSCCEEEVYMIEGHDPPRHPAWRGRNGSIARALHVGFFVLDMDTLKLDTDCAIYSIDAFELLHIEHAKNNMPICGHISFVPKYGIFVHGVAVYGRESYKHVPQLLCPDPDPPYTHRDAMVRASAQSTLQARTGNSVFAIKGGVDTLIKRGVVLDHPDKEGSLHKRIIERAVELGVLK